MVKPEDVEGPKLTFFSPPTEDAVEDADEIATPPLFGAEDKEDEVNSPTPAGAEDNGADIDLSPPVGAADEGDVVELAKGGIAFSSWAPPEVPKGVCLVVGGDVVASSSWATKDTGFEVGDAVGDAGWKSPPSAPNLARFREGVRGAVKCAQMAFAIHASIAGG